MSGAARGLAAHAVSVTVTPAPDKLVMRQVGVPGALECCRATSRRIWRALSTSASCSRVMADRARDGLAGHGKVDDGLAGHEAVGNDQPPLISRAQNGVAETDVLHNAGFQTAGGGDLELVAQTEGPVEHQRHPGDQVAQGVLRGHAHDDGNHSDADKPGAAQIFQRRNQVGVGKKGKNPNRQPRQLRQEADGRLVRRWPTAFPGSVAPPDEPPGPPARRQMPSTKA